MADIYIGIKRGLDGFKGTDFVVGSSSTAAQDFELRIADADDNAAAITRQDVMKALEAFERFVVAGSAATSFPVL